MLENKYFSQKEFECKCGKCTLPAGMPSDRLVEVLCEIREHFNAPLIINSAYRCKEHNKKVGGAPNSRHTHGDAVDFIIKGVPTQKVYEFVLERYGDEPFGIAIKHNLNDAFRGFVHLDTRGVKARWVYK
ncbi:peptidase M15 family protein [Campylobacter sp. MIT 12-8780]|uniref:YcbK family protein n=1 Tax=Campylobacter sp. MIT 12-8780 TaxID=2202200 RepID=UPI00115EC158|nr:D-Ala-D-Ala carboxypeptidase family metallohydrolase [Campylobacter sp. MIT 12-8780]TQR42925.1 peptidase M15 family protein [Campylobacter sp. MIT 12-8780]